MTTKKELKQELNERFLIYFKASVFYRDSKYLNFPTSKEEKSVADKNQFIRKSRYSFWVISVFELCKLFRSKNESYAMQKLLNKLLNNHSKSEWKELLSKDDINKMMNRLNSDEIQSIINKINGLRDEYYGHLDRNPKQTIDDYTPYFEEVEKLLEFSENIISKIGHKVLDTDYFFQNPGSGKANNILKMLVQ